MLPRPATARRGMRGHRLSAVWLWSVNPTAVVGPSVRARWTCLPGPDRPRHPATAASMSSQPSTRLTSPHGIGRRRRRDEACAVRAVRVGSDDLQIRLWAQRARCGCPARCACLRVGPGRRNVPPRRRPLRREVGRGIDQVVNQHMILNSMQVAQAAPQDRGRGRPQARDRRESPLGTRSAPAVHGTRGREMHAGAGVLAGPVRIVRLPASAGPGSDVDRAHHHAARRTRAADRD